MNKVIDYIIALTNLYGLVHKSKVIEIYNMQNADKIDEEAIQSITKNKKKYLIDKYVYAHGDYFVYLSIIVADTFEEELRVKKGNLFIYQRKKSC